MYTGDLDCRDGERTFCAMGITEQKHRWVTRWCISANEQGEVCDPYLRSGWCLLIASWSRWKRSYCSQANLYLNWIEFENKFAYNYIISGKKLIQQTVILEVCQKRVCLLLKWKGREGMPSPKELSFLELIYYMCICLGENFHFFVSFYPAGWTLAGCLFSVVLPNHFEDWHEYWSCLRALFLCSVSEY